MRRAAPGTSPSTSGPPLSHFPRASTTSSPPDNPGPSLLAYKVHYAGAALSSLGGPFLAFGVGIAATPEMKAAVEADLAVMRTALTPLASDREYLNFAEAPTAAKLWDDETHARLRAAKAAYDPSNRIRSNHPVTG